MNLDDIYLCPVYLYVHSRFGSVLGLLEYCTSTLALLVIERSTVDCTRYCMSLILQYIRVEYLYYRSTRGFWNFRSCQRRFYKSLLVAERRIRNLQVYTRYTLLQYSGVQVPGTACTCTCTALHEIWLRKYTCARARPRASAMYPHPCPPTASLKRSPVPVPIPDL